MKSSRAISHSSTFGGPLHRASLRLQGRIEEIERRIQDGDAQAWSDYAEAVSALASVMGAMDQREPTKLLTTKEMAEQMGMSEKTLLRHHRRGVLKPAVRIGRLIRWKPGGTG
jgi:excisionase family DNA binding protein